QAAHRITQGVTSVIVLLQRLVLAALLCLLVPDVRPHLFDQARARLVYLEPPRAQERRNVLYAVDDGIIGKPRSHAIVAQLRDERSRRRVDPNPLRDDVTEPPPQFCA